MLRWIYLKVDEKVPELNELDNLLVNNHGGSIAKLVEERTLASADLWNKIEMKESMLRLKSHQVWLKERKHNTRFFHNSLREWYRRNSIKMVETSRDKVEGVVEVKFEVKNCFEIFFKENCFNKPVPDGIRFKSLENYDRMQLVELFSEAEIKEIVWNYDGSKSSGPEEITFDFFKKN